MADIAMSVLYNLSNDNDATNWQTKPLVVDTCLKNQF